jgi:hypothetical protein
MSDLALKDTPSSGILATLKHARYVIGENPITGFAFGLFVLIVIRSRATRRRRSKVPRARTGSAPTSSAATCSAA